MSMLKPSFQDVKSYNKLLLNSAGTPAGQALASLNVIDSKASGLGAITGLTFAGNVFLFERLNSAGDWLAFLNLACLLFLLAAVGLCGSCLWIISPSSSKLSQALSTQESSDLDNALLAIYQARVMRYRLGLVLTTIAFAILAVALGAYGFLLTQ